MPLLENIFRKTNAKFEIMAPIKPDIDRKQPHESIRKQLVFSFKTLQIQLDIQINQSNLYFHHPPPI